GSHSEVTHQHPQTCGARRPSNSQLKRPSPSVTTSCSSARLAQRNRCWPNAFRPSSRRSPSTKQLRQQRFIALLACSTRINLLFPYDHFVHPITPSAISVFLAAARFQIPAK